MFKLPLSVVLPTFILQLVLFAHLLFTDNIHGFELLKKFRFLRTTRPLEPSGVHPVALREAVWVIDQPITLSSRYMGSGKLSTKWKSITVRLVCITCKPMQRIIAARLWKYFFSSQTRCPGRESFSTRRPRVNNLPLTRKCRVFANANGQRHTTSVVSYWLVELWYRVTNNFVLFHLTSCDQPLGPIVISSILRRTSIRWHGRYYYRHHL